MTRAAEHESSEPARTRHVLSCMVLSMVHTHDSCRGTPSHLADEDEKHWELEGEIHDAMEALRNVVDEDVRWEARTITSDLTKVALREGDGTSRWQQHFGGPAETAAAVAAAHAPPLDSASSRRRRLAPASAPAPSAPPPARSASSNSRSAPPVDPRIAMAKRQERLKAAREERRERELLLQARALEDRVASERATRVARAHAAARAEEARQQLAHDVAAAREQLAEESAAYEMEVARAVERQQQERAHHRLTEQLERLRHHRQTLRGAAAGGDDTCRAGGMVTVEAWAAGVAPPYGACGAAGAKAAAAAQSVAAAQAMAAAEAGAEAEAFAAHTRCAAAFSAWRSMHYARCRTLARAARHHAWRLRKRCFVGWLAECQARLAERSAFDYEATLRSMRSYATPTEPATRPASSRSNR
jgi:hypothetical protein